MNLLHCRQNHNLFMRWNERENKENAVRLIVHSLTHRGERWEGGRGGREVKEWRGGGGGSFVSTYKRDKMVWQYITFQYLLYKKGLLLTVIRTRGLVETRRCGAAEARSQLITWSSALTLCASYMSRPLPPPSPLAPAPPLLSQAWSLSPPCVHSYTWYTGVSQNNFLRQKYLASNFWEIFSKPPFFCRLASVHFCNTSCQKCSPFSTTQCPRILSRFFFCRSFFHPFLTNANYLCQRTFWNLPA